MASSPQVFLENQPIVDPATGLPTDYFLRTLFPQVRAVNDIEHTLAVLQETVALKADKSVVLTAGVGLSGGGSLEESRTFDLEDTPVTPGSYTNADITVDQQGRVLAAANGSGGGGGGSWSLLNTWDFAVDGATSSIIIPVGGYSDIMCVGRAVTTSASTWRTMRYSLDGGSTYVTSGSWFGIASSGASSITDSAAYFHSSATTSARGWFYICFGINVNGASKVNYSNRSDSCGYFGSAGTSTLAPITHVEILPQSGTFTGGAIDFMAR